MSEVKTISPQAAHELQRKNPNTLLIDVRSTMEYLYVGHPVGAIHIPWIDQPDWTVNPDFVKQVRQAILGGAMAHVPILLICRSGVRSLAAGEALVKAGLEDVFNVAEGFEGPLNENHQRSTLGGWRFHGLPWEQS